MLLKLSLGLAIGGVLAWGGYRSRFLSSSGALGILVAHPIILLAGGWVWLLPLITLTISANLWSHYRAADKAASLERDARGPAHGWLQVAARIAWPLVLVLLYLRGGEKTGIFAAFVGALAASAADIWATEIGVLSTTKPRLMVIRRSVPAGTPGAISMLGVAAGFGAAWLVGFVGLLAVSIEAWLVRLTLASRLQWLPLAATLGGMVGCLTDSLLSATAQGTFFCEHCSAHTEKRIHTCGNRTTQVRGWPWLTSEGIDLVASLVGAAVTAGISIWLAQSGTRW